MSLYSRFCNAGLALKKKKRHNSRNASLFIRHQVVTGRRKLARRRISAGEAAVPTRGAASTKDGGIAAASAWRAGRFRRGLARYGAALPPPNFGRGHGHGGRWRSAAAGAARLRGGVLALLAGARGLCRRAVLRHRR